MLVPYAIHYDTKSLDYRIHNSLALLNQVPDLITFYGHYNSSPDSFPISPNLTFVFIAGQCTGLLIRSSGAEKDNTEVCLMYCLCKNRN